MQSGHVQRLVVHADAGSAVPVPWQHWLREVPLRRAAVGLAGREQRCCRRVVLQQGDHQVRHVPAIMADSSEYCKPIIVGFVAHLPQ